MPRPTPADRAQRLLECTAYHEAGHAVLCIYFRRAFEYVTIVPEEDGLGHVREHKHPDSFRPDLEESTKSERRIDQIVLISMAGMAAERRLVGRRNWRGGQSDLSQSVNIASYLYQDRVLEKYVEFKIEHADALMEVPSIWVQVEAVARALLERQRLTSKEVRQICRQAVQGGARLARLQAEQLAKIDAEQGALGAEIE